MSQTLALARESFIRQMSRDTSHAERPRLLAVLDAMISWSAARPDQVRFHADDNTKGIVRFETVKSQAIIWSATPRHADFPTLELLPGASGVLTPDEKASAVATLGAHTNRTLAPAGRLQIGFGALKNEGARQVVLSLLGELLARADDAARPRSGVA